MSHNPHDLHAEFPADGEALHRLKMAGGHFLTLSDRYREANAAILRIEAQLDPASDARLEELKKERLSLLDRIGDMVAAERHAPA